MNSHYKLELSFKQTWMGDVFQEVYLNENKIGILQKHMQLDEFQFSSDYPFYTFLEKRTYRTIDDFKHYFELNTHEVIISFSEINKHVIEYKEIDLEWCYLTKIKDLFILRPIINLKECDDNNVILVDTKVRKYSSYYELEYDFLLVQHYIDSSWIDISDYYNDEENYLVVIKNESNKNIFTKLYCKLLNINQDSYYRASDVTIFKKVFKPNKKKYENICVKYFDF